MRVLIVSALYPPIVQGGAEKAAALLAEALANAGDSVTVVSLSPEHEQTVEQRNGVRVYRLPLDNLYWPFDSGAPRPSAWRRVLWHLNDSWNRKAASRFEAILDLERPDIIHTHAIVGFSISIWREARRRGIRIVHTTHDYYLLCLRSDMHPGGRDCNGNCIRCRMGTAARRYWSNRVDQAISVSKFVLEKHRARECFDGVPASVGYNIASPLRLVSIRPASSETEQLVFGFIGRIEEQKGIQILLASTRLITQSNWRLRIAGSGRAGFTDGLKQAYQDPRIEWLGYTDASAFYASVDVIIVPSVWADPLPYVAFEALQADKALIAARSGGIPEIAALGKVAETYPPGDAAALANIMDRALLDVPRWRQGGFANPEAAAGRLSSATIVAQHQARYRDSNPSAAASPSCDDQPDGSCPIPKTGLSPGMIDIRSEGLLDGHP